MRALLVNDHGRLLAIKRIKPGQDPYWVLPGGGVDPTDASREDALHREIREELAGHAQIHALVDIMDSSRGREYVYLARIGDYDFANRTGPEFTETGRGEYVLCPVPLSARGLDSIRLLPQGAADLIKGCLSQGRNLFTLPDLRSRPEGIPA